MATSKKPAARTAAAPEAVDTSTNTAVNVEQHMFSGETCEIWLYDSPDPNEPRQPFVGLNGYTATLHRKTWIRIPVEVADHLESLTYTKRQENPDDPDEVEWVDVARFPMKRR